MSRSLQGGSGNAPPVPQRALATRVAHTAQQARGAHVGEAARRQLHVRDQAGGLATAVTRRRSTIRS